MKTIAHDTIEELQSRARLKKYSSFADRIRAVVYAMKGETAEFIADALERDISWVFNWVSRYNETGFEALQDRPRSGQPKKLTPEQEAIFKNRVLKGPIKKDDGISRFTGKHLIVILKNEFSADYSLAGVYKLLHRLRLSHITPRPRHPKNEPQKIGEWKEQFPLLSKKKKKNMKINQLKFGSKMKPDSGKKGGSQRSGRKQTHAQSK